MKDFILAALPWIVIGITAAVTLASLTKNSKSQYVTSKKETDATKKEEKNFISQGMSLGMCFGVAVGSALMNTFGTQALTYGICFGMLAGLAVGMNIKRK